MLANFLKPKMLIAFFVGVLVAILIVFAVVRRQSDIASGPLRTSIIPTGAGRPAGTVNAARTPIKFHKETSSKIRRNLSSEVAQNLTRLRAGLPYSSASFDMAYDSQVDRFIIQLKNNTTSKLDLTKYLAQFDLHDLYMNGSLMFYISSAPIADSIQTLKTDSYEYEENEGHKLFYDY